jgi:hypothetical protein
MHRYKRFEHLSLARFLICIGYVCPYYKCSLTGASRPPPTHPVQMPHNSTWWWLQLLPVAPTAKYKCEHICTGLCLGPVQMCNDYNCFFFPLPKAPSPLFFFLSQRKLPHPNGAFAQFTTISSRFHSLKWCRG